MIKIYLASPIFTEYEQNKVKEWAKHLRENGFDVYVPNEHCIENGWSYSNDCWANMVFKEDVKAIQECDEVWCLYYGLYSDSGTAWECGYAYGLGKKIIMIDEANTEVSLMMVQSAFNKVAFENKVQT